MHKRGQLVGTLIFIVGILLAACAAQKGATPGASSNASSASPGVATTSSLPPGSSPPAAGLTIPVQIHNDTVTPVNATFDASVGESIVLRVDSDVAEELHVHSVPEHEFEVLPKPGQEFTFSVAVPGQVAIELHHSGKTVATVTVR